MAMAPTWKFKGCEKPFFLLAWVSIFNSYLLSMSCKLGVEPDAYVTMSINIEIKEWCKMKL